MYPDYGAEDPSAVTHAFDKAFHPRDEHYGFKNRGAPMLSIALVSGFCLSVGVKRSTAGLTIHFGGVDVVGDLLHSDVISVISVECYGVFLCGLCLWLILVVARL
ncbi:hypothetical protein Nepgr_027749 [Nepenthes gracilis]|uniref:Uncharacterized protein n=1 Tax=Nepenthes gracilis TaxID=150966 RepID=A0AAD3Y3V3_NEPGR|nr:hypothetical protein Nepgr_027749 [Nepenthes gracilis]